MKYLTFPTESEACAFSRQEAEDRSCGGSTAHWYAWKQAADSSWCVLIDDDKDFPGDSGHPPEWPPAPPI